MIEAIIAGGTGPGAFGGSGGGRVWAILAGQFELMLVNPHHVKAIPGRKTDAKDCEWIADLLQHGLLRGSFVPPTEIQDLRDLTRYRVELNMAQFPSAQIWLPRRASAPETTRARANECRARCATATSGCGAPCVRRLGR